MHRVGVIGYGAMASYHHTTIPKPENICFSAAYDIDGERLRRAKANNLTVYNTADALLGNSSIDVILVATPNNFHKEYVLKALAAGKHVVCEKPVALSATELSEMIDAAKRAGVVFTVHQNRRMDKDYRIIKKICEQGTLGKVFRIESRVQGSRGIADTWRRRKENGGGMLYDWGVHLIDQLLFMSKAKVVSINAEFQYVSQNEVDDNFRLTLLFEDGVSALVEIGTCNYIMLPIWYVAGEKGTAQIDYWNLEGRILQLIDNDIRFEDEIPSTLVGPSITLAPRASDTALELPLPSVEDDNGIFYKNLVDVIDRGEELFVKPEEVMRTMKILDLAFLSAKKGKTIKCEI